jgi:hypothetical protein
MPFEAGDRAADGGWRLLPGWSPFAQDAENIWLAPPSEEPFDYSLQGRGGFRDSRVSRWAWCSGVEVRVTGEDRWFALRGHPMDAFPQLWADLCVLTVP